MASRAQPMSRSTSSARMPGSQTRIPLLGRSLGWSAESLHPRHLQRKTLRHGSLAPLPSVARSRVSSRQKPNTSAAGETGQTNHAAAMATAAVARHHRGAPSRSGERWRRRRRGGIRCSSPAQEFAALASVFRRRLVVGATTAAAAAVGANFGGVTSFLLGLSPELGRSLRLDVLYPVGGFTRCLDSDNGFEFIYPSSWVGDQTLLYREVKKAELQRSLDPPPIGRPPSRPRNISEPVAAFGAPGSNGELNVSVIVSPVPRDFSIEAFGGPKDVGEVVLRRIARTKRGPDINATLIDAALREDAVNNVKYYKLEFRVESPSFRRHNVAVCCARDGKLYTLNAQAPESAWKAVQKVFFSMADSFSLVVYA
ncbi:psbP domain-containing protein 7, chloroplastic-like isoform X2 [Phragmites australis]|uniref:psbP domain-containing protein 7, chloroplastic-like isoform X2 n=1 Tax=Phragmites australis TaxID=29695 RepID=UPI002D78DB2B|nr:psbP domain-containing protein 7, chloroplastic-like isoform X2 [Phragmites australis]